MKVIDQNLHIYTKDFATEKGKKKTGVEFISITGNIDFREKHYI